MTQVSSHVDGVEGSLERVGKKRTVELVLALLDALAVFFHNLFQLFGIQASLFRQLGNGIGLDEQALLLVSAQIALLGIGFIKDQIDVMLRLGDHVRRDLGIAVVLIAEALGVEVDHDAAAVSKTLIHGAHALAVEAVALISVHVLNRSAQLHAPENTFARSARSDHGIGIHDLGDVLLKHFLIGRKAAGRQNHVVGVNHHRTVLAFGRCTDDLVLLIGDQTGSGGLQHDRHILKAVEMVDHLGGHAGAVALSVEHTILGLAVVEGIHQRPDNAHAFQPFGHRRRVFSDRVDQLLTGTVVGGTQDVARKRLNAVLNALFLLLLAVGSRNLATGDDRRAAQIAQLFKQQNLCALFSSRDRRRDTGSTATNNKHLRLHHRRFGRLRAGRCTQRENKRQAQENG